MKLKHGTQMLSIGLILVSTSAYSGVEGTRWTGSESSS